MVAVGHVNKARFRETFCVDVPTDVGEGDVARQRPLALAAPTGEATAALERGQTNAVSDEQTPVMPAQPDAVDHELVLGEGATLDHYKVQQESTSAFHIAARMT